jgi:Spy/CpxP family protein refolding chaperone
MHQLIKINLVVAASWLAAASAQAQASLPPASAAARAAVERQAQRLTQELRLSAEQQSRLRDVLLLTRQHMDADRTANAADPAALRAAMAYDRAKSEELIQKVLTPAQYVRYQQFKAQRIGQLRVTSQTD